ncbi:CPBP family intramembrane glutamic endopeptidase [Thermophilibacter provencensis]|uniref:Type II CAAX endopeptidase family protein n=1 Tax=Thermophilibacter provencensis TaxID=1852386 RepID=A0ABT7V5H7_9ACTN|nr:type II CAAX endopeptidase family protein [Thermophilibacter provencensis]MDM8271858.1 type II CAAX endopeptidase family protein [Thermophilibacter provencensis]
MEVGIPGEGGEPPAPRYGAGNVVKWLLAAMATAPAYLLAQTLAALVMGIALLTTNVEPLSSFAAFSGLVLAVLWWLYLRPRALLRRDEARPSRPARVAALACALLALGVALQVAISSALSLVLPLFPQVMENYLELMELAGITDEMGLITFVEIAVLAPLAEEALCRGVALEFSLRAFCPEWRSAARPEVPAARFWAANVFQALIFAVMHLNIVQGSYAFFIGLLLGWVMRRTGRLRAAVLLHMAVNAASELMDVLDPLLGGALVPALMVAGIACVVLVRAVACLTAERPRQA